jgi:hypothetical protein
MLQRQAGDTEAGSDGERVEMLQVSAALPVKALC